MTRVSFPFAMFMPSLALAALPACAQAPSGPLPPKPGAEVQQPHKNAIKVQAALVTTPVTVRDARGEMVQNQEAQMCHVTDNGTAEKISHFDLAADALSLVIV